MTVARRALLAAQILALGGPALVAAWIVFLAPPDVASQLASMTYGFAVAVVQGLAGIVWSAVLIHNHIELRSGPNYKLQVMAILMTGMFALIFFTFLLPPVIRR